VGDFGLRLSFVLGGGRRNRNKRNEFLALSGEKKEGALLRPSKDFLNQVLNG
jgi:hypothetical protein